MKLYRENYFDLNVKHFVEKLQREHQITLSYTWVKTALQKCRAGEAEYQTWAASSEASPEAIDGDDVACGREPASVD